jgi:hypothetical protein
MHENLVATSGACPQRAMTEWLAGRPFVISFSATAELVSAER